MSFIIVDVESDGPIPAEFSMVCFGAVLFDDRLDKSFYGMTKPISDRFVPEALAISRFSREQHLGFDDPKTVMESFAVWLEQHATGRAVFVSDNVAFDWQFINYYFHRFLGRSPFGFSGRRIGDLHP
jgi:DNA polymerase III epsilon subunit-like protein